MLLRYRVKTARVIQASRPRVTGSQPGWQSRYLRSERGWELHLLQSTWERLRIRCTFQGNDHHKLSRPEQYLQIWVPRIRKLNFSLPRSGCAPLGSWPQPKTLSRAYPVTAISFAGLESLTRSMTAILRTLAWIYWIDNLFFISFFSLCIFFFAFAYCLLNFMKIMKCAFCLLRFLR